jgi:hypothetical protein
VCSVLSVCYIVMLRFSCSDVVWRGVLWCVVVCCGVSWCVVVCCGVVWCVVVCCGVVCVVCVNAKADINERP